MKTKLITAVIAMGLSGALAQNTTYIEPHVGFGVGLASNGQTYNLDYSTSLPFSPMGLDTGVDINLATLDLKTFALRAKFKINVLPALVVMEQSTAVGLFADLSVQSADGSIGGYVGPMATMEFDGFTVSGLLGLGYEGGSWLTYGVGTRIYLDPFAIDVSSGSYYPIKLGLVYLLPQQ